MSDFSISDIVKYVQMGIKYGPAIAGMIQEATSNDELGDKLSKLAPDVGDLISKLGSQLFPHSDKALQQVGGAIATFDINTTKWVQKACNQLLADQQGYVPLEVDGGYGKKTKAAVELLQAKYGLKVDGLAGKVTQAAIAGAVAALTKKN